MKENKLHTAFLFGAGAVKNSWSPVIRALNEMNLRTTDSDTANLELCRQVYLLRFYHETRNRKKCQKIFGSNTQDPFINQFERIESLKKHISYELEIATKNGEIFPQPEFESIFNKFILESSKNFFTVTTNWDFVIENMIMELTNKNWNGHNNRIHGHIDEPAKLYLPNESYCEPYFDHERYISNLTLQMDFIDELRKINRLVCYGISISPLDYELYHALDTAFNPLLGQNNMNLTEIIIIALKPDIPTIRKRIEAALRAGQIVNFSGYDPTDLDNNIFKQF